MSAELKATPPALTVLAKKNNGVFPVGAVYETIDGRKSVSAHSTREMPIWGIRYLPDSAGVACSTKRKSNRLYRIYHSESHFGAYRLPKSHTGEMISRQFHWRKEFEGNMEKSAFKSLMIATVIIGFNASGWAQEVDAGKMEFLSSCAACQAWTERERGR